jgi:DNA polymerase
MNAVSADILDRAELAALMHFYAEAGVDWLVEDEPIDRFAEFAAQEKMRNAAGKVAAATKAPERDAPAREKPRAATVPAATVAVPDGEAIEAARRIAASAPDLAALLEAVSSFSGCNLRNSARMTAFAGGNLEAAIVVAGGLPGADDDREGMPFSGANGDMLGRMLGGIGLSEIGRAHV